MWKRSEMVHKIGTEVPVKYIWAVHLPLHLPLPPLLTLTPLPFPSIIQPFQLPLLFKWSFQFTYLLMTIGHNIICL